MENLQQNKKKNKSFYTRLIVYRKRQFSLAMLVLGFIASFTVLIFNDLLQETHWVAMAIPLCISGSVFLLFPPTEQWEYKPWQNSAERVEQHFDN